MLRRSNWYGAVDEETNAKLRIRSWSQRGRMSYTSNQLAFNLPTRQHCRKNVNANGQIPGADFTSKEAMKIAKIYFRTMHKKRWSIPTQARRKWRRESSTDCWRPCVECDVNIQWTVMKNFDRHPRLAQPGAWEYVSFCSYGRQPRRTEKLLGAPVGFDQSFGVRAR